MKQNLRYRLLGKKQPWTTKRNIENNPLRNPRILRKMLKNLMKRPTSFEKKIIDLCKKYNLPFKYIGDGSLIINYVNPDFIATDNSKRIIETYCKFWHPENYEIIRRKRLKRYKILFLSDEHIINKNWEQICLNEIKNFKF